MKSSVRGLLVLFLLVAGCTTTPPYERPEIELPEAWKESAPRYAADGRWWRLFDEPELDALVEEARANNADLVIAAARVAEARALLGEAQSFFSPTLDAGASAARQRISRRAAGIPPGAPREFSSYRATLDLSYEIDLFGRLRAGERAARAELEASEAAREAVRLALTAAVAQSYFSLRALDEQIELFSRTVKLREESIALQRRRFQAGLLSEFEFRQLEAEAAAARAQLPPLQRAREQEEAVLSVLLGRSPREVLEKRIAFAGGQDPVLEAPVLPAGIPSELLLRRPDLVEAERQLAAANARVAVARAEMFPSIGLTAALGSESMALSSLFGAGAGLWSVGVGLAQPIFAGGRLEAREAAAQARERALLAQYQKTIQTAFSEVRAALAAQARSRESFEAETAREVALTETLRLARLRYENGIASQLDVLDAERGLLAARSARIDALRAYRSAIADLYRALGG